MTNNKPLKEKISIFIILFINFIFLLKYTERVSEYNWLIAIIISGLYYLIYHYRYLLNRNFKFKKYIFPILIFGFIIASVVIFNFIPQKSLNVDRYSIITSFWDSFLNSEYVYTAKSFDGNMPGPLPFYFILAFPFYLIGELGYFSLFGIIVFALILKYYIKEDYNRIFGIFLIMISAFYLWEIVSRSNIFLNSSLFLAAIILFVNTLIINKNTHVFIFGILFGLLLATRNVLTIPLIILFLYLIKSKNYTLINCIKLGGIASFVFILTFIPFIINHFQVFLEVNPFIIQSSHLMPTWLSIFCIIITFSSYFFIKQKEDIYFYSGVFLFITILFYTIYKTINHGFSIAFYESKIDISYFIFCVPFILFYILKLDDNCTKAVDFKHSS